MNFSTNIKAYMKFLSRNKLYCFVCIAGFAVSLMFVIVLGTYVRQELSVDDFQTKADRLFIAADMADVSTAFPSPLAPHLASRHPAIESYCRHTVETPVIKRQEGQMHKSKCLLVDSTFFTMFDFKLLEGDPARAIAVKNTAVVTETFARRVFGTTNVMGQRFQIEEEDVTITGVMEDMPSNTIFQQADFISNFETIITITGFEGYIYDTERSSPWHFSNFSFFVLGKKGSDIHACEADVSAEMSDKESGINVIFRFVPLRDAYFDMHTPDAIYMGINTNSRSRITLYLFVVILILTVAILNYLNMTVAQSGFRGREAAVRRLLGSSRGSIVRMLLRESTIMTLTAFAIGACLAILSKPFFERTLVTTLDIQAQLTPVTIILLALFIGVTAFVSGSVPALIISRYKPIQVVKGDFSRKMKTGYARILTIVQNAVAITLLICSLCILMQSRFLLDHELGYRRDNILVIENEGIWGERTHSFIDALRAVPGVELASMSCGVPADWGNNNTFVYDGEQYSFQIFIGDGAFFEVWRLEKHSITNVSDSNAVWVNQKIWDTFRPAENGNMVADRWMVRGVMGDFHYRSLHSPAGMVIAYEYEDFETYPWNFSILVSGGADAAQILKRTEEIYAEQTGGEPMSYFWIEDLIRGWYEQERQTSAIMGAFTVLTIIIMVMGILAMSLYTVRRKQKEIAIRKVSGSTVREVLGMLARESVLSVAIAFVVACPIAYYAISRWLENFAYRINLNPMIFLGAGISILGLTMLCVVWQSWRTARANPVRWLKSE